ncbi:OmpA family protein [Desertivirga xinjiangensis]|uniref:OmpA family protein n=1 Tax=Desertivirga xinjiangensis TaxID=539206 RepID=UPI00210A949E|nr:OmpA family protein [Pedobacter xinjiangensis]
MRFLVLYMLVLLHSISLNAQENAGDLKYAKSLQVNTTYVFSRSPVGYGKVQEFKINKRRSPVIFKIERNTIWLKLGIPYDGILSFEIKPKQLSDDYDWMLYRYNQDLASAIARNNILPVRSNISRNDLQIKSRTGLAEGYINSYANAGPGKSFSKPLDVKAGDSLAIIIDNIYDGGAGFSFVSKLKPSYPLVARVTGKVFNSEKQDSLPAARIVCEDDLTGVALSETYANQNGEYSLAVPLGRAINVTAQHPGFIFKTEDISLSRNLDTLDFYLEPPADGKKLLLFNIHFSPDKDLIMMNATPDLVRLANFLKEHGGFDARIIGHTNNNPFAENSYLQQLSFKRALAIKKNLVNMGISEKRLSCIGVGGKNPIIVSKNPLENLKNLRVEVLLEGK